MSVHQLTRLDPTESYNQTGSFAKIKSNSCDLDDLDLFNTYRYTCHERKFIACPQY